MNDIARIRERLERSRAEGVDFDVAWKSAMRSVRDGHARHALNRTRWSWEGAYIGDMSATSREKAAAGLFACLVEPEW